jgi:cytochrome d ubiquinol oxidase subunit II
VLVSSQAFANSLTISNAAAGHYGLVVITVAAAIFTPLVLPYQSWTYYVFRNGLGGQQPDSPVAVLADADRSTASESL